MVLVVVVEDGGREGWGGSVMAAMVERREMKQLFQLRARAADSGRGQRAAGSGQRFISSAEAGGACTIAVHIPVPSRYARDACRSSAACCSAVQCLALPAGEVGWAEMVRAVLCPCMQLFTPGIIEGL